MAAVYRLSRPHQRAAGAGGIFSFPGDVRKVSDRAVRTVGSGFTAGKQPYIRQFENYVGILLGQFPESCEQRGVCSFQNIVEADGSVYPCDFYVLDEYRIGNLNEDSFETIHERRLKQGFVEASCNHTEECRACPYFMICRGGCRRHREQPEADREKITSPVLSDVFDACLPRLQEIAAAIRSQGRV